MAVASEFIEETDVGSKDVLPETIDKEPKDAKFVDIFVGVFQCSFQVSGSEPCKAFAAASRVDVGLCDEQVGIYPIQRLEVDQGSSEGA